MPLMTFLSSKIRFNLCSSCSFSLVIIAFLTLISSELLAAVVLLPNFRVKLGLWCMHCPFRCRLAYLVLLDTFLAVVSHYEGDSVVMVPGIDLLPSGSCNLLILILTSPSEFSSLQTSGLFSITWVRSIWSTSIWLAFRQSWIDSNNR